MKSLKTYIREESDKDFEKNIKKMEKSVGAGVSAAGVYESWVFIVARLSGDKIRPTPTDIDNARNDTEFHNKGEAWFTKIGWTSGLKDEPEAVTDNGYRVAWIIDAIQEVGKDVKDIPGITWGKKLNGKIIHENLGKNYYDKIDKMWREGDSKENTADIVFVTKGSPADLTSALEDANKAGTITWGADYGDSVNGRLSTKDKKIQWFQVSLKKGIEDARIGKVSSYLRQKYADEGFTAQIVDLPTSIVQEPITNEIIRRGNYLGVSYGFDDRIDQILLDEGLFDVFKSLKDKLVGSIKKLVDWASTKLRKIVGGAVKLARKSVASNPVLDNANAILATANMDAKTISEGFLVEKTAEPIKFKSDKARTNSIVNWRALKKQLSGGMVNKEYAKIQLNIDALNASKAEKFKKSKKDAVLFLTTVAAGKLEEKTFEKIVDDIIKKLDNDKWRDGDLTSMDYFLPLKVASHYTAYNAINVILLNLKGNIKAQQNVIDAAKTFVADIKAEAKFGNTRLPLYIVYGHGGKAHYMQTKPLFHKQSEADIQKVADDANIDQPYVVVQITPSKSTEGSYGLGGHNTTQVYLMSGLKQVGEDEFKTNYLILNFTTSSGSKFTMKAEVEKEMIKEW